MTAVAALCAAGGLTDFVALSPAIARAAGVAVVVIIKFHV